jgi:hypothetical protein
MNTRRQMGNLQGSSSPVVQGFGEAFISLAQDAGLRVYVT